jgi:hypothetical protein
VETPDVDVAQFDLLDFNNMPWVEKMPGIQIKEGPGMAGMSYDLGWFTADYPMHRFRTTTMTLMVRDGACNIVFADGQEPRLQLGSRIIIPPMTWFSVVPATMVLLGIACTPCWNAADMELFDG